jgi:hypothetical protein
MSLLDQTGFVCMLQMLQFLSLVRPRRGLEWFAVKGTAYDFPAKICQGSMLKAVMVTS